jgi:hypothetical protein
MLSKLEILLLTSVFSLVLLSSLSFAITCSPCEVNNCVCSIGECSSGILRIYPSSSCKTPSYEYTFSSYQFTWNIAPLGTYYFKVFCADGKATSCTSITVRQAGVATTTTEVTTEQTTTTTAEQECVYDSDCSPDEKCVDGICEVVEKKNYTWIIVVAVVAVVVIFFLLFFISKKRPKRRSFEELYRKWSR